MKEEFEKSGPRKRTLSSCKVGGALRPFHFGLCSSNSSGLEKHKLNFGAIQKLLPHRSRSQIRTHYRYLARNIEANNRNRARGGMKLWELFICSRFDWSGFAERPQRRLRTRGRPSRSQKAQEPTPLFNQLATVIEKLEREHPTKQRGRPAKNQIGTLMDFTAPVTPAVRVPAVTNYAGVPIVTAMVPIPMAPHNIIVLNTPILEAEAPPLCIRAFCRSFRLAQQQPTQTNLAD